MFLPTASVFEILAAIQIGDKAFDFAQSLPMMKIIFGQSKKLNSKHSQFYRNLIGSLKVAYNLDDDSKLPLFVRPDGETRSNDITINTWFSPELLDENLMLSNHGKFGQKILLIDANVINSQLLKTYDLIADKSSFSNVILGYIYYFTNFELVLMTGHPKEIEHLEKIINVLKQQLDSPRVVASSLSDTDGRLHNNLNYILEILSNTIKPKLQKQIDRKTVKEKLDQTAQNFHLATYSLLNSILLITEGNVNYHLSMDPKLLKDGYIQTGTYSSWYSKDHTHSLNPSNPLKNFLMKAYYALHKVNHDTRGYENLDVMLPNEKQIKDFLKKYKSQIDEAFTFITKPVKGSDTLKPVSIFAEEKTLDSCAKFILKLAKFSLSLLNSSYAIENILDLLTINNNSWGFDDNETKQIQKYFLDIEQKIKDEIKEISEFCISYKQTKVRLQINNKSGNELLKYLNVVTQVFSKSIEAYDNVNDLSKNQFVNNTQLNNIKRETLLILDRQLKSHNTETYNIDQEIEKYESELALTLYFYNKMLSKDNHKDIFKKHFNSTVDFCLKKEYGDDFKEHLTYFFKKAYEESNKTPFRSSWVFTEAKQQLNENEVINVLLNLIEALKEIRDSEPSNLAFHHELNLQMSSLRNLKSRLFGLVITRQKIGSKELEGFPEDLDEIHYQDYLAIKENQVSQKVVEMEKSLNESSLENAKLHQTIKEHITELAKVNKAQEDIKEQLTQTSESLKLSQEKIDEQRKTQISLEGHIDKLLDSLVNNIEDCNSEVMTLDDLSEALKKVISNKVASTEVDIIMASYDVICKFKERMKVKFESLSSNASNIFQSFEDLKNTNKLITDSLKIRTEQVLKSYNVISERINTIIQKLAVQSDMLNEITSSLEKSKKDIERKEKQDTEEEIITPLFQKERVELIIEESKTILDPKEPTNDLKPILLNDLQMYSAYCSNQWLFYFRMSYKQNKCANLFQNILNNNSLMFEHRLLILDSLINKIITDSKLQKLNTGKFNDMIHKIKDLSQNNIQKVDREIIHQDHFLCSSLANYNEDLRNDVDSGIFYDLTFGRRKYI